MFIYRMYLQREEKSMKKQQVMALAVSAAMIATMTACGSTSSTSTASASSAGTSSAAADTSAAASSEAAAASTSTGDAESGSVTFDQIELGKDYTDVKADLKFLTNRTDLVDTDFADYIKDFQSMYPDVTIEYEGITNYADDITTRLSTGDWGDICMIPTTVSKSDLGDYFISYGDKDTLSQKYTLLDNFTYDGQSYGIPSMANLSGIVYNKKVFSDAGIDKLPTTPGEFIADLQLIKDKTDAIPLYTNFAAGWTMSAWDAYIDGVATGDPNFINAGLDEGLNPFSDRGDGTGPYAVYNILYEAVSKGLTEDDPTTTDWEGSKGMLNNGEVACMVLGSWAIPQMQSAGDHADDIAYMPFPISINGTQYATEGPDYFYGINKNNSADNQIAAMCYVKYLVEKSGYAAAQGGIDCTVDAEMPDFLAAFDSDTVKTIQNQAAPEGKETLHNDINNESELGLSASGECATEVVESAIQGDKTMDELADEWNQPWTKAQEDNGVTPAAYTPTPAASGAGSETVSSASSSSAQ